ncbi:MAG: dihydrofolate reductase family protein [Leptospirales bacterium]
MKKVIFQMSISLDGYFEGPNREIDWHLVDNEFNAWAVEMLKATDLLVMGRRTYELMASYWPTAKDNDTRVKEQMNGTPKLVFSRTLNKVEWQNSRLATGSIAEETARLKQVSGDGRIYVGGSQLGASFLEQGLVDELHFILMPVLLGKGNTVLDGIKKRYPLRLLSTKTFQSGNMLLIYEPSLR